MELADYGNMHPEDKKLLEIAGVEPTWRDDGDPLSLYCSPRCHGIHRSVRACDRCGAVHHVCIQAEGGLCRACAKQN